MLDFPATARNREAIAGILKEVFPSERPLHLLEVASGSGQHAVFFAQRFPTWTIQPSDLEPHHLESIRAYTEYTGVPNLSAPVLVDCSHSRWELEGPYDGLLAINLIHISPWSTTVGLLSNARRLLRKGGALYLYGAYRRNGEHTSESNREFDRGLREQNPDWGVRCLDQLAELAQREHGLRLDRVEEMPSNNLSVVFRAVED